MMKKRILLCVIIILLIIFAFVKINTNIYVGDFSWDCCSIDIQIKIDDKLILNDSLYSNPHIPRVLEEKLRYGFHTINVSSKKADVNQEKKIFLLPNQYIYVEFFSADTLCIEDRIKANEMFRGINITNSGDTLLIDYELFIVDTTFVENEKSRFWIGSMFNPFYTE